MTDDASHEESQGQANPPLPEGIHLVAQLVKNPPAMQETWVQSLGWEDPWRRESLPIPVFRLENSMDYIESDKTE